MTATTPARSDESDAAATGAVGAPTQPETGGMIKERDVPRFRWLKLLVLIATVSIITGVVTTLVMDSVAEQRLRKERQENALRDLRNRLTTEDIGGKFTRVYYVGDEMRATWVSDNDTKRCNMPVVPPTSKVMRYSTTDVKADVTSFAMLQDPDALGCLQAVNGGGIGGG